MRSTVVCGAALMALAAAGAQAQTAFSYGTNWLPQAEHGGFYQSVADGTYAACGLDVTIVPGGPQVNGRALLLAGKIDAYMGGNMLQPFNALNENIPIVVIAASFQKEPQVLMTHPGKVKDFAEIATTGMKVLVSDESLVSWYKLLEIQYGFKAENREPYTFNSAPFIADPDTAQQGYVTSEPFAIQNEAGWTPDNWLLADYGFGTYSTTIEVTRDTLETKKDALKCFVDGTALGWVNYLYGDNAAANALIKADNPDMSDAQIAYSIEAMKQYGIVDSGEAATMGVGAMTDEKNQKFYADMVAAGVLPAGLDISKSYTLEFVNQGVGVERRKELTGK